MSYVYQWQQKLGLNKWYLAKTRKNTKNMAECHFDPEKLHKLCAINIGNSWEISPTDHNLELVACHEVLHVLLYDLVEYAKSFPQDVQGILEKEHEVVNILEKTLVGYVEQ